MDVHKFEVAKSFNSEVENKLSYLPIPKEW